jgi:hypothetical protein
MNVLEVGKLSVVFKAGLACYHPLVSWLSGIDTKFIGQPSCMSSEPSLISVVLIVLMLGSSDVSIISSLLLSV